MHEAGTQDSGLFFCASYENWAIVFFCESRNVCKDSRTRWSSSGSGLQLLPILLIHKGFLGCVQNSDFPFGKEVGFRSLFFQMSNRLSLPPAGLRAGNDFRLAPPLYSQASEQIDLSLNNPSASQRLVIPGLCSDSLAFVC